MIAGFTHSSSEPLVAYCDEPDTVTFSVRDNLAVDSVHGSYPGPLPCVIRPISPRATQFEDPSSALRAFCR